MYVATTRQGMCLIFANDCSPPRQDHPEQQLNTINQPLAGSIPMSLYGMSEWETCVGEVGRAQGVT